MKAKILVLAHTQTFSISGEKENLKETLLVDYPNDYLEIPEDAVEGDVLEETQKTKSVLKQIKSVFIC